MSVLVTGHEGYVGASLLRFFLQRGGALGWGRRQDIATLTGAQLRQAGVRAVVHCATAMDRTGTRYDARSLDHRVNVLGTQAVVAAAMDADVPLIHISTKDVFGPVYGPGDVVAEPTRDRPKFAIGGDWPFRPQTVYAKSKLMSEFVTEVHPRAMVIRLSTCYTGFFHHRGNWMMRMARALAAGETVTVSGSGRQCRDPLHADDLGRLIEAVLASGRYGTRINAGGGPDNVLSVLDVVNLLHPHPTMTVGNPGGDNGEAERLYGWRPQVVFRDYVSEFLDNIASQRSADR